MKRVVMGLMFFCMHLQAMDFYKKKSASELDEVYFKKCVVLERYYALNDALCKHHYSDTILNALYPCDVYGCGDFTQKSALLVVLYSYGSSYQRGDKSLFFWKDILQNLACQKALKANYTVKGVGQQFLRDSRAYTYSLIYILLFKGRYVYTNMGSVATLREFHYSGEMQECLAPALEALELLRDYDIRFNRSQGVWVHEESGQNIRFYSLFHVLKDCYAWRFSTDEDAQLLKNSIACLLDMDIDATVGAAYVKTDFENVLNDSSLTINDCCGTLDDVFKDIFNQAVEANRVKKESIAYLKSLHAKLQQERLQKLCDVRFAYT